MKLQCIPTVLLACQLLVGCELGKATIHGQVFIVTKAHQSIKLGLVTVALHPEDAIRKHVARREAARDAWMRAFESAKSAVEVAHSSLESTSEEIQLANGRLDSLIADPPPFSGKSYLDSLPEPLENAKTNADGEFTLGVPRSGKHVLVAHTKRLVMESTEEYTWIVSIPKDVMSGTTMLLSNENLTTGDSPLSLVHTNF